MTKQMQTLLEYTKTCKIYPSPQLTENEISTLNYDNTGHLNPINCVVILA